MLVRKLVAPLKPLWTHLNDLLFHIETGPAEGLRSAPTGREWWRGDVCAEAAHGDNFRYATIDYWNIRWIVRMLQPCENDVFYDIGCGKGRIVCMMARRRLRKCVGIEILAPLCKIAKKNSEQLRGRKSPIEIVCADARAATVTDGTIYFMFNPFGPDTLRDTIENIRRSLANEPRHIKLVYYNSVYDFVLASADWLVKTGETTTPGGLAVGVWENRSPFIGTLGRSVGKGAAPTHGV